MFAGQQVIVAEISLIFVFVPNMILFAFDALQPSQVIGTGTFACGSVIVEGEDFIAENVTFENSSPEVFLYPNVLAPRFVLHAILIPVYNNYAASYE